ncbi:hypothetical protein IGI04_030268 [Brassica rapa subsp. trilocularis]|uniref:Uncharacterized protein n=1 Tax=Brassica rapa subsp. trilocularis TaxID=1813537 RepID=A0ABQ7LQ80_BRACM|nr:hypothetical protein IGI04_030268 [Brassica rapa subsp. trilocularis]
MFLNDFEVVWMWINEREVVGIYRRQQPIRFRLVAARVSVRRAPIACTAAPRAPHGFKHGQDSCRAPPLLPDVRLHDRTHARRHSSSHMAGRMLRLHARRHLVLLHVSPHAHVACVATPCASLAL